MSTSWTPPNIVQVDLFGIFFLFTNLPRAAREQCLACGVRIQYCQQSFEFSSRKEKKE